MIINTVQLANDNKIFYDNNKMIDHSMPTHDPTVPLGGIPPETIFREAIGILKEKSLKFQALVDEYESEL